MEIKLIPLSKFRCFDRNFSGLAQQVIEFHRKELYSKASKLHFTLNIQPKTNEWVEVDIIDGHNKKHKLQLLDRKLENVACSCKEFVEHQLSFCVHVAALKNIIDNGHQYETDKNQTDVNFPQTKALWIKELRKQLFSVPLTMALYKTPISFFDSYQNLMFSYGRLQPADTAGRQLLVSAVTKKQMDSELADPANNQSSEVVEFENLLIGINLYDYQKDILQKMVNAKRAICSMAMGSGKTLTTIGAFSHLKKTNPAISMLVVCPKALKLQWGNEIERVFERNSVIVYQIVDDDDITGFFAEKKAKVGIVTYQYINRHLADFIKNKSVDILVADEIQFVRNNETKTWKTLSKLQSTYFFGLSGTVIENKLDDLYNIMEIIKPGFLGPKWKFDFNFQLLRGVTRTKILYSGLKNIAQLRQKLQSYVFSYDKVKLPPIKHNTIYVTLDPNCRTQHDNYVFEAERLISKSLNTELSFGEKAMLQAFLLKARQCCDSDELITKQVSLKAGLPAKVVEFLDLVKTICIDKNEKLVVFSEWTQMLDILARETTTQNVEYVLYTGDKSLKQRQEILKKFQTDPKCKIFFSSDAGGVGLDGLQLVCNNILHFELPWNPARLDQRTGRVHRLLQKNPVSVFYIVAQDSIEQKIEGLLSNKRDIRIQTLFETNKDISLVSNPEEPIKIKPTEQPPKPNIKPPFSRFFTKGAAGTKFGLR